jgi:ABC-type transport system involved in multi-copper enzyme maturation permease subunit
MKERLSQLVAVALYEMLIQWRRKGLPLVLVTFTVISLTTGLAFWILHLDMFVGWATTDPPLMLLILATPLVVADTIPKDRHYGVRELLQSLPISHGVYLNVKLLGVWIPLSVGLVGIACLFEGTAWLVHGWVDLSSAMVPWMLGVVPLALFITGMSVLLPSSQANRRKAMLVGGVFALFSFTIFVSAPEALWQALRVAHAGVSLYLQRIYLGRTMLDFRFSLYSLKFTPQMIAVGAAALTLAWLITWSWMRRKEG